MVKREALTEHRRRCQQQAALGAEPRQAGPNEFLHSRWQERAPLALLPCRLRESDPPCPARGKTRRQQALFHQRFERFHQKDGMAFRLSKEPLAKALEIRV